MYSNTPVTQPIVTRTAPWNLNNEGWIRIPSRTSDTALTQRHKRKVMMKNEKTCVALKLWQRIWCSQKSIVSKIWSRKDVFKVFRSETTTTTTGQDVKIFGWGKRIPQITKACKTKRVPRHNSERHTATKHFDIIRTYICLTQYWQLVFCYKCHKRSAS